LFPFYGDALCTRMSVQQKGFICLPFKDRLYLYSCTYLFNSTVTVIAAVIMAFDVTGCGEEPSVPTEVCCSLSCL